jgi:hypothetical protein
MTNTVDAGAIGLAVATFFNWLPEATALLSFLWLATRLYDWIEARYKARKEHK